MKRTGETACPLVFGPLTRSGAFSFWYQLSNLQFKQILVFLFD